MRLTFCPPARGGYPDGDNVLAANKGALDALATLWGVDDRRFRIIIEHGERCQFGAVIVTAEVPQ